MVIKKYPAVAVASLTLLCGLLIFRDFVFGNKVLLYKDIGSDSLNVFYPYYAHLSDYLRETGIPLWSFNVGMGQDLFSYLGTVIVSPVVWLAKESIPKALVYQHLLYVAVCGMLFAGFLSNRGLTFAASLLGPLLLAFSGYMVMGSCWYGLAHEVVCFTALLFAAETALKDGRWFYLTVAVAIMGLLGPFHLYLCGLFLCFYTLIRFIENYSGPPVAIPKVCFLLAAAAVVGIGLTAFVWLDSLGAILTSPRGSGLATYANELRAVSTFALENPLHYATALLRQFGTEMLGTGDSFRGWQNYLEAPLGYCGLFCLLMLPQVFVGGTARQRLGYGLFLSLIAVPMIFPWFRYLFWLFQGDYYRTFSLFSVFGIVTLSMTAFSRYVDRGLINLWLLGLTLLFLLVILYLPVPGIQALVARNIRQIATLLLLLYAALLMVGRYCKRASIVGWLIVALCAIELCYFDRITVAYRPTVTKAELKQRVGYNDYTADAVRDVRAADKGFYRITKLYASSPAVHRSLNDALVFEYYDTASYSSFNNTNYIRFLMALDVIPKAATENQTRWAPGLVQRRLPSTFACEKYVLTVDPVPFQVDPAYRHLKRYDRIYLFENKLFVPLGLFCTRYFPETDFLRLSTSAKERLLLHAVVLPASDSAVISGLKPFAAESSLDENNNAAFQLSSFDQNRITGELTCDSSGVLVFQTPFDRGWQAFVDGTSTRTVKADIGLLGVKLPKGRHFVEMRYLPPFLKIGGAITALSLLVLGLSLWRWPRISPAVD